MGVIPVKINEQSVTLIGLQGNLPPARWGEQDIHEEERRKNGLLPLPILRSIIQRGEATLQDIATRVDRGMEAIGSIGEKAGKRVQELVGRGAPQGKALLEDLLATPQRKLEALQKRIDERVKKSVERFTSLPAVQQELSRIEKSIARLEERLGKLRGQNRP